ncbi:MAG TPA: 4-(cytidine 5'-diphospho)-2-C-methyl-D-erythritol kinase [Allosphingosinicella sp.]|nr:4-(cytidine 5'-diphospho)-2-C-methyl-D-erythritol kinase [Allosphingosinicella sp.]
MRETAYAKINLALHVRGRMPDGYHRIETIFAFAEAGDEIEAAPAGALELAVGGPFAASLAGEEDNLVARAARALSRRFGVGAGVRLTLDKRLPVAAGIGGGSADAAAALRLLSRWWRLDAEEAVLLELARGLGADIAACLGSRPARGEGRGDLLRPFADDRLAGAPVLLVNPGVPLSTAAVFRAWDGVDRGALAGWREGRNDLEPVARRLAPAVADVLDALKGASFARMSGSGATCFGLYASAADRDSAARSIAALRPQWWILATRLRA